MQPENTQQPVTTPLPESTKIPVATPIKVVKNGPRQRHFLAAFFISFMWGMFGADRMYMGYWGLGILKLVTFGGFGIWVIVDLILIMGGYMRDKQGREMLQVAEYKKFAARTVLIFAIALGVLTLLTGIEIIAGISQLMNSLQNGSIPGLDSLNSGGLPSDLQQALGQ
jgi:TM2 domain-containing membrane protein YozV